MNDFDYEKPISANSLTPSISSAKINFNQNLNYLIRFWLFYLFKVFINYKNLNQAIKFINLNFFCKEIIVINE